MKLEIVTILDVNEFDQSFTVDVDYRLKWKDHRLTWPMVHEDFPFILDVSWRDKLWIPDIYFKNALDTKQVYGAITPITHIEVNREREVSLVARLQVKAICDMELFAYPHDRQTCFLDSTSLSYSKTHLNLTWSSFDLDETIYFPKFSIDSHTGLSDCPKRMTDKSCIRASISLSRKLSFYVTRVFAPTTFITCIPFLGYYIGSDVTSARVTINLTPLLSLIMLHNVVNNEIQASYVVGLHIWMFVCMFFTFMGLVEFTLAVAYDNWHKQRLKDQQAAKKKEEKDSGKKESDQHRVPESLSPETDDCVKTSFASRLWSCIMSLLLLHPKPGKDKKKISKKKRGPAKGRKEGKSRPKPAAEYVNPVDLFARICAPLSFALFACSYFTYFLWYSQIQWPDQPPSL